MSARILVYICRCSGFSMTLQMRASLVCACGHAGDVHLHNVSIACSRQPATLERTSVEGFATWELPLP